ncbi:MAG: hypothetical protein IAG13_24890, partial [Deltaproteobacteria bacterium]|nr:hypothetical protein [Nannocystaceae bacterium]
SGVGPGLAGRRTRAPWLAVSLGPRLAWAFIPRMALWAGVEGVVTLARPRLVTDEGTLVLQPGRAGLRALAGVELRFAGALQ